MYLDFFGLKEKPFSLTPDPRFLFLSESHRQALDHMTYGIREREGFILIVGDIGTGKTTICRELLEKLEPDTASALILNPMLSESELLEAILEDFGILAPAASQSLAGEEYRRLYENLDQETQTALDLNPMMPAGKVLENILSKVEKPSAPPTKKELIDRLNAYLLQRAESGGNAILIIDEAQNLSMPVLEQIRILSNLETPRQKLLQIVLVGQLELRRKLEQAGLRQLNQRISVRYQIKPMTLEETKRYMEHRLFVAGANASVTFTEDAHRAIYEYSRGVPRLINLICERSMLGAFVDQVRRIDAAMVERCRQSLESNLDEDEESAPESDSGASASSQSRPEPRDWSMIDRDTVVEDSVNQPWERKAGSQGSRWLIVAALAVVTLALAAMLGYHLLRGKPGVSAERTEQVQSAAPAPSSTPSNQAQETAARSQERVAVPVSLSYSIQLGAFQNMDDALEQQRLLSEQGLKNGLYVVPLHLVQLGGRWYRLFYGGFPSNEAARSEMMRLVDHGTISAGSARIVETPLAFKLGDYDSRSGAESGRMDFLSRFRIPAYTVEFPDGAASVYRLYAGAFEKKDQSTYLADILDKAGVKSELVERSGLWKSGN